MCACACVRVCRVCVYATAHTYASIQVSTGPHTHTYTHTRARTLTRTRQPTGLFKRLCVLLYHNIKPVIVFDGPAPTLKRKTLELRKNIRDRSGEHLRKVRDQYCMCMRVFRGGGGGRRNTPKV